MIVANSNNANWLSLFIDDGPCREYYLNPDELALIDPTNRGRNSLRSMVQGNPTPVPRPFAHIERTKWLESYRAHVLDKQTKSERQSSYWRYVDEMMLKYGPQGDRFSFEEVRTRLDPYYTNAFDKREYDLVIKGRDYLIRTIRQHVQIHGIPTKDLITPGVRGTSACLPSMGRKGDLFAESLGSCEILTAPIPTLTGQRSMRQKHRVIFGDSVLNVRYIEDELKMTRNWLKREFPELFSAWMNPALELQPRIYDAIKRKFTFCSFDYDHCDEHFSRETYQTVLAPIYKEIMTPNEFTRFDIFVSQLFTQPVFMGDYLLVGLHNLFSGQAITNDFETIYGVCLALGSVIECRISPTKVKIFVLGDDLSIAIPHGSDAEILSATVVKESNRNGMVMQKEKCGISTDLIFLRRVYYLGLPVEVNDAGQPYMRGAYPTILALNSIINPEWYIPCTDPNFLVALFQRLDNVIGSPDAVPFIQFILSNAKNIDYSIDLSCHTYYDWWFHLYGETWNISTSPSYKLACQFNLIK